MNDIGGARPGQRNLSEASSDLAGSFGLDLVGEAIAGVFRFALGLKQKTQMSSDALELPIDEDPKSRA